MDRGAGVADTYAQKGRLHWKCANGFLGLILRAEFFNIQEFGFDDLVHAEHDRFAFCILYWQETDHDAGEIVLERTFNADFLQPFPVRQKNVVDMESFLHDLPSSPVIPRK